MNKAAHTLLTHARTLLLLDHFFFGRLALYLKLVEEPAIPTLAVDGKHIFYNPDFVLTLPHNLVMSAIVHEIGHCMFDHIVRRGGRDPKLWNHAGDYVINDVIKDAGFDLGPGWLWNAKYKDMSAEHIYDLLKQEQDKNGGGEGPPGEALCEIRDASQSQAEMQETHMEWKIAISQAMDGAKKHGAVPKGMERFIEDVSQPKVNWREVLQRFINQVCKDDYVWSRPNRRYLAHGLYMPSLYSERMGEIAVVIDTSGSIDQPTLNAFGAEIQAIVASSRPTKTRVIYCDAAVNHVDEFTPDDSLEFKMHGGGGTDFRPPFKLIEDGEDRPVALVYLTDLYGPHGEQPDYPVLWVSTTDQVAPWGDTLKIEL